MQGEKSKPQKPTAASRRPQTVPDVAVPCCPVLQFTPELLASWLA